MITFSINEINPNVQDGEQYTQRPGGSQSSRIRHPADAIFAEPRVSTSTTVHFDWYSSVNIDWTTLLTHMYLHDLHPSSDISTCP